jgi:guanylate kinase
MLELDVQGAESIKQSDLNAHFLFISPPSVELLEDRLRGRGTETDEQVRVRLAGAHHEMSYLQRDGFFEAVVTNDEFESSYASLLNTLSQFYPNLFHQSS